MTLTIREDGRVEWTCKHGIGHTIAIPYKLVTLVRERINRKGEQDAQFSHGCDGCCDGGHKDGPKAQKLGKY